MVKRIFDITISFFLLILLLPAFIVIGLLIKVNDGGSILFKQKRVGKNGKIFTLYKFRTMTNSGFAEKGSFEPGNTSRVTSAGHILRKLKLDEIPQLMNVLKGEMSLVGPRPEIKKWTEIHSDKWAIVHSIKPGMTDNASIEFRNEEEILSGSLNPEETYREIILPRKLEFYINYVNEHSFFGDIKILLRTIYKILSRKK